MKLSVIMLNENKEKPLQKVGKGYFVISGGMQTPLSWTEYLKIWNKEGRKRMILISNYIKDRNLIGNTGEWQNNMYFRFSDNEEWGFTWRAWGDLMQAIVNKKEGYMKYYM